MHHIFHIVEIVNAICGYIYDDAKSKHALVALAMTCRAFQETALSVLWKHQESLVPLLLCLGDAIKERRLSQESDEDDFPSESLPTSVINRGKILYALRPPTTEDIQRVLRYTSKIKTLTRGFVHTQTIHPSALSALLSTSEGPILPNLRTLEWPLRGVQARDLPFLARFLSPRLTSLSLFCPEYAMDMLMLDLLGRSCRELTSILFECEAGPGFAVSLRDCLLHLGHLQDFTCTASIDMVHILILAQMPHVDLLDIRISEEASMLPPIPCTEGLFPQVRQLTISSIDLHGVIQFFGIAPMPCLEKLWILLDDDDYPALHLLEKLEKALTRQITHETLTVLSISSGCSDLPWDASKAIRAATLEPLFVFGNLEKLELDCHWCYDLDDSFIASAAKAWPRMEEFTLDPYGTWPPSGECHATMMSLLSITQYCPSITWISSHFEGRAPAVSEAHRPGNGHHAAKVHSIEVGNAGISAADVRDVAAFLSDIFPNLRSVCSWSDQDSPVSGRWQEVASLARWAISIRSQERCWYGNVVVDNGNT
ncbi:unnamed protein product [Somion occarium]|uniref:F-box domain-containing protein n=1 Tax=Somion occarium TaxID=3059160 RepID=A0ABP1DYZ7_9APHY